MTTTSDDLAIHYAFGWLCSVLSADDLTIEADKMEASNPEAAALVRRRIIRPSVTLGIGAD